MMSAVTSLGTTDAPPALRIATPGWRDPRLWIGLVILAASVLGGARLLNAADDLVPVWAASHELVQGDTVTHDDLVVRRVRFDDPADLDRYLLADDALPTETHLLQGVGAGELVPRSALGAAEDTGLLSVPISIPPLSVPPEIGPGSTVDVWVTSENEAGKKVAKPLLIGVVVIAAPPVASGFGNGGERQLVLGVDAAQEEALGKTLAAIGESAITVVSRG